MSENLKSNLEIFEFLDISKHDSEWEDEHRNDTELLVESENRDVVSEPYDDECVHENPDNRNDECERVVIVVSLTQRTRDCQELGMSQWQLQDVLEYTSKARKTKAVNVKYLLVDGLID